MQLGAADIHGIDLARAAREQHSGKAAGGGADIEADPAGDIDRKAIQRSGELHAAARDVRMRGLRGDDGRR